MASNSARSVNGVSTAVSGLVAGLAGSLAMYGFRLLWDSRRQASPASGIYGFDEEADINSVDQLFELLSLAPLPREETLKVALLLHFGYGAAAGIGYAFAVNRFPASKALYGTAFGTLLWMFGDELAITASGLSHPRSKTASSHLSALFAHLLFGSVTEISRSLALKASSRRHHLS